MDKPMQNTLTENNSPLKSWTIESLHVLTLLAFAVAQPLYALLGNQVGFFTANQIDGVDILLIALTLSLLLAVPLILIRDLGGLVHQRLRIGIHSLLLVTLMTALFLPLLNRFGSVPDGVILGLALTVAGTLTFFYLKKPVLQSLLTFLSPTILIFPLLFIAFSDATPIVFAQPPEAYSPTGATPVRVDGTKPTPVVMVILDELPLTSLLNEQGELDTVRYPNFAQLASDGTWYPNTYTVGASTLWAVPAILSGRMPNPQEAHSADELNQNLFTVLGPTHTFKNVSEKHTALCPKTLCKARPKKRTKKLKRALSDLSLVYLHIIAPPNMAQALPDVSHNWGNFAWSTPTATPVRVASNAPPKKRPSQAETEHAHQIAIDAPTTRPGKKSVANHKRGLFHKFIRRIQPYREGDEPPVHFLHILMPHVPYNYLPSGKHYRIGPYKYFTTWQRESDMRFDYQRHLLQVGATDALLGELIQHLKTQNLYDRSLIVVVADHGANWGGVGQERRKLERQNYSDLIRVPLFIKAPGQETGRVENRAVRTVDILPTMADVLNVPLSMPVDGTSVLDPDFSPVTHVRVMDNQGEQSYDFPVRVDYLDSQSLRNKIAWFGTGDWQSVFTSGDNARWAGKPVEELPVAKQQDWTFELAVPAQYSNVDLTSDFVPALVEGRVTSQRKGRLPERLAIAVNDVVWCTIPLLVREGDDQMTFGGLVPESGFTEGINTIRVFAISGKGSNTIFKELNRT